MKSAYNMFDDLPNSTVLDVTSIRFGKDLVLKEGRLHASIIICLGGVGGLIGAFLKRKLSEHTTVCREIASKKTSFLLFDTIDFEKLDSEVRDQFFESEFSNLGGFNPSKMVESIRRDSNKGLDLMQWWNDGDFKAPDISLYYGTGGLKHIGRLCLFVNSDHVRHEIEFAIHSISKQIENSTDGGIDFYILAGSCGGTGSGMLVEMSRLALDEAIKCLNIFKINAVLVEPSLNLAIARRINMESASKLEQNAAALYAEMVSLQETEEEIREGGGSSEGANVSRRPVPARVDNMGKRERFWDGIYVVNSKTPRGDYQYIEELLDDAAGALLPLMVEESGDD